jgi:hypothetical protein
VLYRATGRYAEAEPLSTDCALARLIEQPLLPGVSSAPAVTFVNYADLSISSGQRGDEAARLAPVPGR